MTVNSWVETAENVWMRPMHGQETYFADFSQYNAATTICSGVSLETDSQGKDLVSCIRQAWIALRYRHPSIGCRSRTGKIDNAKATYTFEYNVQRDVAAMDEWANQTSIYHQVPLTKGDLADTIRDKCSKGAIAGSGEYLSALHFARDPHALHKYHMYLCTPHFVTDARGALLMLHYILSSAFENSKDTEQIWGSEVSRLCEPLLYKLGVRSPGDATPEAWPSIMKKMKEQRIASQVTFTPTCQFKTLTSTALLPNTRTLVSRFATVSKPDADAILTTLRAHEMTFSYAFGALFILAMYKVAINKAEAKSLELSIAPSDQRWRFEKPNENFDLAVFGSPIKVDTSALERILQKYETTGDLRDSSQFWAMALDVQKQWGKAKTDDMNLILQPELAIAASNILHNNPEGHFVGRPFFSPVGRIDDFIKPCYGGHVQISDPSVELTGGANYVAYHVWSWQGKLTLQRAYGKEWHELATLENFERYLLQYYHALAA